MTDGDSPPGSSRPTLQDALQETLLGAQQLDAAVGLENDPVDPALEKQREHRLEALAATGSVVLASVAVKAAGGPRNAAIILKNPMALAASLDPVQKLRVSEALEALARDPEGAQLVKQLDDLKLPVVVTSSLHDTGGAFFSQAQEKGAGLVDVPQAVKAPGISTQGGLVALFAHELQHLKQAQGEVSQPFNGKIPPPEDAIRYDRIKEADAQATATEIAWRLKQQGDPAAWNSLKGFEGGWVNSPARAYESAAEADPAAVADGRAKRAAFDGWFTAKAGKDTVAEVYIDQGLNNYPSQGRLDLLAARGAKQENLTEADYQRVGALSEPNYLALPGAKPLTDPYYAQGRYSDYQQSRLANMTTVNAGQAARLAPPPADGLPPAPHLSGDDALYLMNDKLSLRHVTSRGEVDAQYAGPGTGDAFPLSGAGKIIASQAAAGDTAPLTALGAGQDDAQAARFARLQGAAPGPGRAAGIVAQNEDFVTSRYEQAIRDQVVHSFLFDGPSDTSHFMILRGLQNADRGAYDPAYAYGKQGRAGIQPGQVLSSLALGPEDLDALSRGRSAEDILTGKVIKTVQGLRTGDPSLVSDLRPTPTNISIPNGLVITPTGLDPAAAEALHSWSVEALRQTITAPTAADRTRLDLLAEKAITADPGIFLQQAKALLGTGNPHAGEVEASVPSWAERAFTALGEKNPALVAPVARYLGNGLPEGDRLKTMTDNVLAGRPPVPAPEPVRTALAPGFHDARPGAEPPAEGRLPLSRINGGAQGAVATLGLVQSGLGLYDAYETGDRTEGVISGVNLAVSGTAATDAVLTAAGKEVPLLAGAGKFLPGLNVATMVATGAYQISKEDTVQHKEERAVAVGVTTGVGIVASTATASAGEAAVLTGTLGAGGAAVTAVAAPVVLTTIAVVEVARTGDALIKDKRAWADTEASAEEYARPERMSDSPLAGGKPSILNYRHLPFELMEVSPGMLDANMTGTVTREAGGRIPVGQISKLDMTDPRNIAEFERALDAKIQGQGDIMKGNASVLPVWLRFGASGEKYEDAKLLQESMLGARAELDMYKRELADYNLASSQSGPQSMFLAQNSPAPGITSPAPAGGPATVRKTPPAAPKVVG